MKKASFCCKICDLTVTSEAVLKDHVRGKSHRRKMNSQQIEGGGQLSQHEVEEGLPILEDPAWSDLPAPKKVMKIGDPGLSLIHI